MDYPKLFETQQNFDSRFTKVNKTDRIRKNFIALMVEVGETLNEVPTLFKYWSKDVKPSSEKTREKFAIYYKQQVMKNDHDLLLEEFVDVLHFILSLGNELEISSFLQEPLVLSSIPEKPETVVMDFYLTITTLYQMWSVIAKGTSEYIKQEHLFHNYKKMVATYLLWAKILGYTDKVIEAAYYEKNQVNIDRQKNGY